MVLQTIARILADKLDLAVTYSPNVSTFMIKKEIATGKLTVVMSTRVLEMTSGSEQATKDITLGALVHEALGHGYHTDFTAKTKSGSYAESLAGVMEDVRIENEAPKRFIGARRLLSRMVAAIIEYANFWAPMPAEQWQGNLVNGLVRKYRCEILGQPVDAAITSGMLDSVGSVIGSALLHEVDSIFKRGCLTNNTQEVCDKADEIVALLAAADLTKPEEPKPPEPSNKEGCDDEGKNDSSTDQSETDAGDDAQDGDSEEKGTPEGKADGDAKGKAQAEASDTPVEDGSGKGGGASAEPFDPDKAVAADIEAAKGQTIESPAERFVKPSGQHIATPSEASLGEVPKYEPDKETHSMVALINRRIEDALQAMFERQSDFQSDVGTLDMTRLVQTIKGLNDRPFTEELMPADGIDTELMLVFDASSSMKSLGREFMRGLIYSTLSSMSIYSPELSISLVFFTTNATWVIKPGTYPSRNLIKKAASSWHHSGGTDWVSSMAPIAASMAASPRKRKIILTVTDGKFGMEQDIGVVKELAELAIECQFLSVDVDLPKGATGIRCAPTHQAVAEGFYSLLMKGKDAALAGVSQ